MNAIKQLVFHHCRLWMDLSLITIISGSLIWIFKCLIYRYSFTIQTYSTPIVFIIMALVGLSLSSYASEKTKKKLK